MQKEKRNVLIVVIAAVVIIGIAIGLFFLISFVKDRNYKKEHWVESDTTVITLRSEYAKEEVQKILLNDFKYNDKDDVIIVNFTIKDDSYAFKPDVEISNSDVIIRKMQTVPELPERDYIRDMGVCIRRIEGGAVFDILRYKLYKDKDNDSLEYFKTIEIRIYYNYRLD